MFSYFSSSKPTKATDEQKDEKNNEKIITFAAKSDIDNFPSKIIKPSEQTRYENLTQHETKLCEYLSTNYKSEISKCKLWTEDIIPRFVTDTYYIKDYQKRLDLTKTRFEQYLQHRSQYHFDDILTLAELNTPKQKQIYKESTQLLSMYYYGIDNEGHPCLWDNGAANGKGDQLQQMFCKDEYERASYWRCRLKRKERNLFLKLSGHYRVKISKSFYIFDIKNVSTADFFANRAFHQWQIRTTSELFPETMHKMFIVNAPWVFQMIWKIVCTFLDEITVEKTVILGTDYLKELTKYIDMNMIPKEFGGNGIWGEPRASDVPIGFPFQMDGMETEVQDDDAKGSENDVVLNKEYVYKNINYCNNKIVCLDNDNNDVMFELPSDKDVLHKIKKIIADGQGSDEENEVMIVVSEVNKDGKVTHVVLDANLANT